jgi:magnesium-protoporphyrin O-methyltransferase
MLSAGASIATAIEASNAFARAAQEEAKELGWSEQVDVKHGDFTDLAETVAAHDIVTLDRVICCYHDMESLVQLSTARASKLYGLVYPRDVWWNRILSRLGNLALWITRNPFRTFIHSDTGVQRIATQAGLEKVFHKKLLSWQVVVYAHLN